MRLTKLWVTSFLVGAICSSFEGNAWAQFGQEGYDDYGTFSADPVDLDREVTELFGRYFQTSLLLGTGILTNGLGQAYSAGPLFGLRFIFFFDKIWAAELGAGYASSAGYYTSANTGTNGINIALALTMIPVNLGIRYGFDQDRLPRGFATMNPYLAVGGELFFRNETVVGSPQIDGLANADLKSKFGPSASFASSAFGLSVGGGIEFDVYRKKLMLGVDLRYHLMFWSDSTVLIGNLDRTGDYITVLGTATYNY